MATFLQVTAVGGYFSGTWSGETAQCNWTLIPADEDPRTTKVVNQDVVEFAYDDSAASGSWDHGNFTRGFGGDILTEDAQKAIANAVWEWMDDTKALTVAEFQWSQVILSLMQYDAVPPTGWGQLYEPSTFNNVPKVGAGPASPFLPPQSAICVSHYTAGSGGRNRGRTFIPFHWASGLTGQLVSATVQTTLFNATDTLFDTFAGITLGSSGKFLTPSVVSRAHRTYSTITEVRIGDEVDTQRRRRNFRSEVYSATEWPTA